MTVEQLIKTLEGFDKDLEVYYPSYYIDEDYDWDENLEIRYIDSMEPVESVILDGDEVIIA